MKSRISVLVVPLLILSLVCNLPLAVSQTGKSTGVSMQPLPGFTYEGQAPADLSVLVSIAVPLRNTDALASVLKEVSDPASPQFGHFYTPTEIKQEFLPSTQHDQLLAEFKNAGLQVVSDSLDSVLSVRATVDQVKRCFGADVSLYNNGTDSYYITSGNAAFNGARIFASNSSALFFKPQLARAAPTQFPANVTYTRDGLSAKVLQTVYNATALYAQGFQGENQTVGLMDFYGAPTIYEDLAEFNQKYGFPAANLTVVPIGPYAPNLGVSTGWSGETSLDVEIAHAAAPKANLILYVGAGSLSTADALAPIIEANEVTTLSMSFGAGEALFSSLGPDAFYFNVLLPDQLFMLGSLQGMTFLASSGDGGGCTETGSPAGNAIYPSSSPYVTDVGGTQIYAYTQPNGTISFVQTAWSNHGWVPYQANYGGGGGGVSYMEPKPWYQSSQQVPASFPNGRLGPDLSLQAGVYPGIYIIDGGQEQVTGGTSLSSPLLAGLLSLVAQSNGAPLGLVNPFLYSLGNDPTLYTKAYTPITYGYIIPWTSSYGYNLATGWGAPNIGEIAHLYKTQASQSGLSVIVSLAGADGEEHTEYTNGETIQVTADITNGAAPVTNGSFTAQLVTLTGTYLTTPLTFSTSLQGWACNITLGDQSGLAYLEVNGTSGTLAGDGFAQFFAGYFATFFNLTPADPWTTSGRGLQVIVTSTDLDGNLAPLANMAMQVQAYDIQNNTFTNLDNVALKPAYVMGIGIANTANLTKPYVAGPLNLALQGNAWGFLPFMNGISMRNSKISADVYATPGVAAPKQTIVVVASPMAPINVAGIASMETGGTVGQDVSVGANVTAALVNPARKTVATTTLILDASTSLQYGQLQVPENATPGLYTILLNATYDSDTLGYVLNGAFFSQIWVADASLTPKISFASPALYMGQTAQIVADIRYANGQEATYGLFSATVYPQNFQEDYATITYAGFSSGQLVPLRYNPTLNRWTGNVTLPSPYNLGAVSPINGNTFELAGPYEAYVSGLTYDGVPTTGAISAQQNFFIQPYVYVENQTISSFQQTWGLALSGNTINGSATLANSVFLGVNSLRGGTTAITNSVINGTLIADGCSLTLQGVHGGNVIATNSTLTLVNSDLDSLTLTNSKILMSASSYRAISPPPPTIQILSPTNGASYVGDLIASVSVSGSDVNSVAAYLNGAPIRTFNTNGTNGFTIPTKNYADGTYTLQITATQSSGVSTSANTTVYFTNQATAAQSSLDALNSGQTSLQNQLNGLGSTVNSSQTNLQNQLNNIGTTLSQGLGSLNSSQSSLSNQVGNLGTNLNSLNSTQTSMGNQLSGLGANLNSSQASVQAQIGDLGANLTSSLNTLQSQISSLKDSLNTAQLVAVAGVGFGIVAVVVALVVGLRKRNAAKT